MSIRLACPNCQSALTYPDNAAGIRTNCPKCKGAFKIPVPNVVAQKEIPEASIIRDETPMPDSIDRPAARPVYKQTSQPIEKKVEKRDSGETKLSSRRSSERVRKKVRIRKKDEFNPVWFIVAGVVGIVLIVGAIVIGLKLSSDKKEPSKSVLDSKPSVLDEPKVVVDTQTNIQIPPGWSQNPSSTGFRVIWPIREDNLGYTPDGVLTIGYDGTKPNNWSYAYKTDTGETLLMSVTKIDLKNLGSIDAEAVLDNHAEKMNKKSASKLIITKFSVNQLPAMKVEVKVDKDLSQSHWIVADKTLWIATIVTPPNLKDDSRVSRFLKSFAPLSEE